MPDEQASGVEVYVKFKQYRQDFTGETSEEVYRAVARRFPEADSHDTDYLPARRLRNRLARRGWWQDGSVLYPIIEVGINGYSE